MFSKLTIFISLVLFLVEVEGSCYPLECFQKCKDQGYVVGGHCNGKYDSPYRLCLCKNHWGRVPEYVYIS